MRRADARVSLSDAEPDRELKIQDRWERPTGKADKTWRTFEATGCGHDVMVDKPEWLVDVLLQVS